MEIEDYIPFYPAISSPEFGSAVYAKKELRVPTGQPGMLPHREMLPHQTLVARYMSDLTLYDAALVFHEMGTGKTCTAVATVEGVFRDNSTITRALVLVKGASLVDNFINELVYVCAPAAYGHLAGDPRVRSKLRSRYEFATYEMFAKRAPKLAAGEYDGTVIVVDEVHNLVTATKEEYVPIHAFLHSVRNCKVLLMSGTPMRDQPSEIADVLNLILPLDNQMPTGSAFNSAFFRGERLAPDAARRLSAYTKGIVSYVRSAISDVDKVYVGERLGALREFVVFPTRMSSFQTAGYMPHITAERDLYSAARQAALFVFPDGTSGAAGFATYMHRAEKRSALGDRKAKYTIKNAEFRKMLGDAAAVRRMSCKYAFVLDRILADPAKLIFVYCEFVEGSGLVLFSKILEAHGFERSTGKESAPGRRYSIITNTTTTPTQTRRILAQFNSRENRRGALIQVVLGSRVVSEGFTLKNVAQVHILTPHWNYGETDQAVARAFRAFSHDALIADGEVPQLDIYQHVALVATSAGDSIDLRMYEVAETKDVRIKQVERVLKESAFDCPFNVARNTATGADGKRQCEYQQCAYTCTGVDMSVPVDATTYDMFYASGDVAALATQLPSALRDAYVVPTDSPLTVVRAVDTAGPVPGNGVVGYVRIDGDRVYASPTRYDNNDSGNMFYFLNPVAVVRTPFADVSRKYVYALRVPLLLADMCASPSREVATALPLEVQNTLVERAVQAPESALRTFVLDVYKQYIRKLDTGATAVSLAHAATGHVRCLDTGAAEWRPCTESEARLATGQTTDVETRASGIGYFGIVSKNKFLLKKTGGESVADKRLAPRGRVCTTMDKAELLGICSAVGIDMGPETPKKDICTTIQQWFTDAGLVVYT